MARPRKPSQLANFIGNTITVKTDDMSVVVPQDKEGNKLANMVMAAQVRSLIQETLKKIKEKDMMPTPAELKAIAESAKAIASFSAEIYQGDAPAPRGTKKATEEEAPVDDDISFDGIIDGGKIPEVQKDTK